MYVTYNSNPVPVTYTQEELRQVIESYLKEVDTEFSFRGLCSYIVDKAIKEGKVRDASHTQYSSCEMSPLSAIEVSKCLWELIWVKRIFIAFGENPYVARCAGDTRFIINGRDGLLG